MFVATTKFFGSVCTTGDTRKEVNDYCKRMGLKRSDYTIKQVK